MNGQSIMNEQVAGFGWAGHFALAVLICWVVRDTLTEPKRLRAGMLTHAMTM
jgi:hypothetical protein